MEAQNEKSKLWCKNANHRDNGSISIGSIIRFPCPLPIDTYMRFQIPMIKSITTSIIIRNHPRLSTVAINEKIEANTLLGFVYNCTQVDVEYIAPIKKTCSENICDRQTVAKYIGSKGCYGMSTNRTS